MALDDTAGRVLRRHLAASPWADVEAFSVRISIEPTKVTKTTRMVKRYGAGREDDPTIDHEPVEELA